MAEQGGRVDTPVLGVRTPVRRTPPFSLSIFMINPHSKGFYPHFTAGKTEAEPINLDPRVLQGREMQSKD